jgi:hypothetical protein
MKKLLSLLMFVALVGFAHAAEDARLWISRPPDAPYGPDEKKAVDQSDVFEVVASRVGVAVSSELSRKLFVQISERTAKFYTGSYYRCPQGKKPYLFRAVYTFGGTGHYLVVRHQDSVWVEHVALGSAPVVHSKSALVVNLDFEPTAAYATTSVVE